MLIKFVHDRTLLIRNKWGANTSVYASDDMMCEIHDAQSAVVDNTKPIKWNNIRISVYYI